jgi:hypothetical protein
VYCLALRGAQMPEEHQHIGAHALLEKLVEKKTFQSSLIDVTGRKSSGI